MMRRLTVWGLVLAVVCAADAAGAEGPDPDRRWGLGWDDGLTLRRLLGAWEVGVSAGPNDWLSDDFTHTFGADLPDSVDGALTDTRSNRRESGFVRLQVARAVGGHRTLQLSAVAGGRYSWSDDSRKDRHYYLWARGGGSSGPTNSPSPGGRNSAPGSPGFPCRS